MLSRFADFRSDNYLVAIVEAAEQWNQAAAGLLRSFGDGLHRHRLHEVAVVGAEVRVTRQP